KGFCRPRSLCTRSVPKTALQVAWTDACGSQAAGAFACGPNGASRDPPVAGPRSPKGKSGFNAISRAIYSIRLNGTNRHAPIARIRDARVSPDRRAWFNAGMSFVSRRSDRIESAARDAPTSADVNALARRFDAVRARTLALVDGLDAEDLAPQSMADASPGKWHLAHTTWFFDTMVIEPRAGASLRPHWQYLFNSYYDSLGARHPRPQRGLLTRPSLAEVLEYRREVERRIGDLLASNPGEETLRRIEIGTHHEEQHQELLVTDLKHLLSHNPLEPAWRGPPPRSPPASSAESGWIEHRGEGVVEIGHRGTGFCFDNERPVHRAWLQPFALAARPVSCAEYLQFIDAGGYAEPRWWLSDGWAARTAQDW